MRRVKAGHKICHIRLIGPIGLILLLAPLAHAQTNAAPTATPSPTVQNTIPSAQVTSPGAPTPAAQPDEIDDIRPPFFFFYPLTWLWIALVAAAIIALLFYCWKWMSHSPFLSPKTAYELTLEKLEKARKLLREDDPVPYAVFVSETIRTYLGQRFQAPSTRRTTEEFLRMMEADKDTPLAEHSDLLRNFLQSCDLVKFAKYQPTLAELEQVQQNAFTFVHATKPAPENHFKGRTS